ncbi:hypothetical protein [Roseomonas sp. WA12]
MESLWLVAGIAGVNALALFRLRQMLGWERCEATFLGMEKPIFGGSYMGQALLISFPLPDGGEVRTALRNYSRGDPPRLGARLHIRYHPGDPERVEWAAAVPVLVSVIAILLAVLVVVLRRMLRDAGFVI